MAATLPTLVLTSLLPKAVQKRAGFAFILRMPEKMPVRDWFRLHWWARQAVQCTPRVKLHEVKNETGDVFKPMRLIGSATVETRDAMEFLAQGGIEAICAVRAQLTCCVDALLRGDLRF